MGYMYTFAATPMEAKAVEGLMGGSRAGGIPNRREGQLAMRAGMQDLVSIVTGMGPASAARRARQEFTAACARVGLDAAQDSSAIKADSGLQTTKATLAAPSAAIVIGFAGSLSHSVREGEIVIYESCSSADDRALFCSHELNDCFISRLRAAGIPGQLAAGISVPRIAASRSEKLALAEKGAQVVDMESYQVMMAAREFGIPATVIRVISDSLDTTMPDFNSALRPDGEFAPLALGLAIARQPVATAKLFRSSKRALTALTAALRAILAEPLPSIANDAEVAVNNRQRRN